MFFLGATVVIVFFAILLKIDWTKPQLVQFFWSLFTVVYQNQTKYINRRNQVSLKMPPPQKIIAQNRGKVKSGACFGDWMQTVAAVTAPRCLRSSRSDLYHCLLSNAGAPPQLVKTACLNLHTSGRITALGVLVCWQQFILMCCHNMEFFDALHHGANKSHCTFSTTRCSRFSKGEEQSYEFFLLSFSQGKETEKWLAIIWH